MESLDNLRPPQQVMRLSRMGSFHQHRLSFMRVLLRRLKRENWQLDRPIWRIDDNGVGVATYRAKGPERTYTLVAFAHDLPDDLRSDRVIAEAWDATFTLYDGEPTAEDIERLSKNVPLQEAGRISENEFSLSRANRSVRLFKYVVDRLAEGKQPELDVIESVGYLMRTTAVYGSGKFGAADRDVWCDRQELRGSFQPELLSVWLTRWFTIDLVEHLARARDPERAVQMKPEIRRRFGVGNSTGLGMAPFLINHPELVHAWINARETALARIRRDGVTDADTIDRFHSFVERAATNVGNWLSEHPIQQEKLADLSKDFPVLIDHLNSISNHDDRYWDELYLWSENNLSVEGQEHLVSLMMEVHGELVDDLAASMNADEQSGFRIDGSQSISSLKSELDNRYGWTQDIDFSNKDADARVWYVSEEKLEPRLGERYDEPIEPYEQPLSPARDVARLMQSLSAVAADTSVGEFLSANPQHRHIVRRVQRLSGSRYGEIIDNTIAHDMLPIDLLRCKLSFFGATRFDPRSDRWVRINMYQGAPFPDELSKMDPDDCFYPPLRQGAN